MLLAIHQAAIDLCHLTFLFTPPCYLYSDMPYEWSPPAPAAPQKLALWPYRSLPRKGFAGVISFAALMLLIPLLAVIGSPVLWGLLPFFAIAVWGLWMALQRSYRDGEVLEELTLSPDRVDLVRHAPRKPVQRWQANPYWVQVVVHPTGGPVPHYVTLKGGAREVEIGAFLSEDERKALGAELQAAFSHLCAGQA